MQTLLRLSICFKTQKSFGATLQKNATKRKKLRFCVACGYKRRQVKSLRKQNNKKNNKSSRCCLAKQVCFTRQQQGRVSQSTKLRRQHKRQAIKPSKFFKMLNSYLKFKFLTQTLWFALKFLNFWLSLFALLPKIPRSALNLSLF